MPTGGWEVVVVGAGSGGGVVAGRLSESPRRRVLLLEAGPDHRADVPASVLHLGAGSAAQQFDWGFTDPELDAPVRMGRLVGGSGAVNGTFALRGQPDDYDSWAQAGAAGWEWARCLPCFRRLEADADFGEAPYHGKAGPIHIGRATPWAPTEIAFVDACLAAGHGAVEDLNAPGAAGVGPLPRNVRDGVRQSTLVTYLAAARGRPNLTIRGNQLVDRIRLDGDRATGVVLASGEEVPATTVVLAAGAYGTPLILQRSGIGDPSLVANAGVDCAVELPGVGAHLLDHPVFRLMLSTEQHRVTDAPAQMGPALRFSSYPDRSALDDLKLTLLPHDLFALGPSGPAAAMSGSGERRQGTVLLLELDHAVSEGLVQITGRDAGRLPHIVHNHLTDPRDLATMTRGAGLAYEIAEHLMSRAGGDLLFPDRRVLRDPAATRQLLMSTRRTGFHPSGTCRMGNPDDPGAVTDERGKVLGIQGLRVADASLMPSLPRGNANLTTIMIGERMSELLSEDL